MSATTLAVTDPFEVFANLLTEEVQWTPEKMDAAADEYQRDAIASAQSEAALAANVKEYSNAAR